MKKMLAVIVMLFAAGAQAKTYTVVTSHSPGDIGDNIKRSVLKALPYVPEYAPGGDAVIAPNKFVKKPRGDYLFFSGLMSQQVLLPAQRPELVEYVDTDFVPITQLATSYFVLFSGRKVLLERYLQADNPSVAAPGSNAIFITNLLAKRANRPVNVVPYKQMAQGATDALAGHVDFALVPLGMAHPLVADGRGYAVAITSEKRIARLPDTPTLSESFPGLVIPSAWGLYGQKGMVEADVANVLSRVMPEYSRPEVKAMFEQQFLYVPPRFGPAALVQYVVTQRSNYLKIKE